MVPLQPQRAFVSSCREATELGREVKFVEDTYMRRPVRQMHPRMEKFVLRTFVLDKREKKNDPEIAKTCFLWVTFLCLMHLVPLTVHRVPLFGPAAYLPAYAGFLLEKEVDNFTSIFF